MTAAIAYGLTFGVASFVFLYSIAHLGALLEIHHGYLGIALCLSTWGGPWIGYVGLALLVDDAAQHLVQIKRPAFRSPLHIAYRHLLYNPACGVLAWACAALFSRGLK